MPSDSSRTFKGVPDLCLSPTSISNLSAAPVGSPHKIYPESKLCSPMPPYWPHLHPSLPHNPPPHPTQGHHILSLPPSRCLSSCFPHSAKGACEPLSQIRALLVEPFPSCISLWVKARILNGLLCLPLSLWLIPLLPHWPCCSLRGAKDIYTAGALCPLFFLALSQTSLPIRSLFKLYLSA